MANLIQRQPLCRHCQGSGYNFIRSETVVVAIAIYHFVDLKGTMGQGARVHSGKSQLPKTADCQLNFQVRYTFLEA